MFNQLPSQAQAELYTKFLFNEFLWKFRRLFSMRKSDCDGKVNGIVFEKLIKQLREERKTRKYKKSQKLKP